MDDWDHMTASWTENVNGLVPRIGASSSEHSEIESGQVWRARWDDVVSMVFVDRKVGSFQNLVRVAPVTVGADLADDLTVVLPADSTSLSVSLSVWTELSADIAEVVLERWIANVDTYASIGALIEASDAGILERGLPILNLSGRRAQERRRLALFMEALSGAVHLISGNGSLPDMIAVAGLTMHALCDVLGIKPATALKIANGTGSVDIPQARVLAARLEVGTEVILASNPPIDDELYSALTRLSVRPRLTLLGELAGLTNSEAVAEVTRGALALAARKEGDQSMWNARVDLYFKMRLGEQHQ